jgi:hypothetical protein
MAGSGPKDSPPRPAGGSGHWVLLARWPVGRNGAFDPQQFIRPPDKLVGARPQTQQKTNLSTEDSKGDEIGNE